MVAAAKGKFVLLLNNDAELHENALSTLYRFAVEEKVYGIVGLPQYDMQTSELIDIGSLFDPFLNPIPNKNKSRGNVGMVIGACMWLPRKLWKELGGFPEWFESLAEDMYLCCCARLKGHPVIGLAASGFNHWIGGSFGGGKVVRQKLETTYRRRAQSERNKSYVMILCYPSIFAVILIPLHFLFLAVEGLLVSAIKKERRVWKEIYQSCFSALWLNRNRLIRLRRKIQASRRVSLGFFYSVQIFFPYKLVTLMKYGMPSLK
jgi:GT2 family glycosyltransferase